MGFFPVRAAFVAFGTFCLSTGIYAQKDPYEMKIGHPRIIMTKYDELALRFIIMEDPLAEKLKNELKKDADKLLTSKDIKFKLDRRNTMLDISREYLKRIITLSMAYRIFEEDKYSDKAIDQMLHVCTYPDWNPAHFLDVAEMTTALAIGYDWNFYHMNLRERETIRNKIVEYGLRPGLDVYQHPDAKPHVWYKMKNNWNQVCAGGLIMGALAVGEDFPELKNNVIYHAIKNLIPTLSLYEPDGVWYEGPAYWGYANSYLAMTMSSLLTALEHDFGLSELPGLDKTAGFYVNSVSPTGELFNFADAESSKRSLNPALFWFGKTFQLTNVSAYYRALLESNTATGSSDYGSDRGRLFYLALPWFDDGGPGKADVPYAQKFRGLVDLLILQGKEDGKNAIYLAAKGGKGTLNHQQLDIGSFVIDAQGARWGMDLGSENYFLPGFFQREVGGGRWEYYRNTNKSHSTLVIGDNVQYPDGESRIIEFNDALNQPFGIFDMSAAYPEAAKVERGFKLLSEDQILIRDEITFGGAPNTIRWGMMTDAKIELMAGDKAVLTKNGKKFFLKSFTSQDVSFRTEEAKAYHKDAKENPGKKLLYILLNEDLDQKYIEISVVLGNNMNGLSDVIVNSKLSSW
ncbi:MAG: DUF4962 domain-containing protein [Cytophagales bacterium]|nr:DUF4962 domain-containing protein [Cytophagales bacterium]